MQLAVTLQILSTNTESCMHLQMAELANAAQVLSLSVARLVRSLSVRIKVFEICINSSKISSKGQGLVHEAVFRPCQEKYIGNIMHLPQLAIRGMSVAQGAATLHLYIIHHLNDWTTHI